LFDFYHLGDFIMRWRDIRREKPTEADGDKDGRVIQLLNTGNVCKYTWKNISGCIAWMPVSELPAFEPIPDPPEGWRFVRPGEAIANPCQIWDASTGQYRPRTYPHMPPMPNYVYIVPIDPPSPPEPQYRPFASAAEFRPHRDKWVRRKEGSFCKVASYEDCGATMGTCATVWKYKELFAEWEFADGTPFGVRIDQ
jgi:hypothetical protein